MSATVTSPEVLAATDTDLPEGWTRTRLPEFVSINMGQSPPGSTYNKTGAGLPFFQGKADFGDRFPKARVWCTAPNKKAANGDVLISVRAPVGPTNIADRECAIGRGLAALRPLGGIPSEFLLFALRLQEPTLALSGAGSTFTAISKDELEAIEVDLPPLAEQERIVEKVEQLQARVSAARERLARVPAILKRFRQAVLAAACSGRLTADWREKNQVASAASLIDTLERERRSREPEPAFKPEGDLPELPDGWLWATIDLLTTEGPQNGVYKPKSLYGSGVPIIRIESYQDESVMKRHELSLVRLSRDEQEMYAARDGDVLINRVNSPSHIGKCMVISEDLNGAVFESNMMKLRLAEQVQPQWLTIYLRSADGRQRLTQDAKWAVNQVSINQTDVRSTAVPLPTTTEQGEIIRRVEALFKLADAIERRVAAATARAEKLTQAILAKAFRGELVLTEAELARREKRTYEPASALLARLRAQQPGNGDSAARTRRSTAKVRK